MNAIEVRGLRKSYPGFALEDVNLTLPQGGIMGLVGENGAGKSTLIKLIMNASAKDGGSISVLGTDNEDSDFVNVKQDIGVVLDEAYFPETLTAKNLNNVMRNTYQNWSDDVFSIYLKKLSLPLAKEFKDFSRGMKMKLAIAVAMSHSPKLLILDEATSGLDPMVRDEILDLFNDFTRDESHSILLSSHIVSDLEKICDYIAFIHKGRLLFCEEKDRILEKYAVLHLRQSEFEAVPKRAVKSAKKTSYGVEALVLKSAVSPAFAAERSTLEDIILLMVKGDAKQ